MIKENIKVIRSRGGVLNNALGDAMSFLDSYIKADGFATLTGDQITAKIAEFEALKDAYLTAKTSFEAAVASNDPIVEEL